MFLTHLFYFDHNVIVYAPFVKALRDVVSDASAKRSGATAKKNRAKSLLNISILLFSATLCQRSLRIFFEYAAFAFLRLAKNHHKNPLKAGS
jgi:hypothetical protein